MKNRAVSILVYILAVLALIGVVYYVTLPPISIYSAEFWSFFFFLDAVVFVSYWVIGLLSGKAFPDVVKMPSGKDSADSHPRCHRSSGDRFRHRLPDVPRKNLLLHHYGTGRGFCR